MESESHLQTETSKHIYAPERIHIPEHVAHLDAAIILEHLANLDQDERNKTLHRETRFVCFALTLTDEFGRPYSITGIDDLKTTLKEANQDVNWNYQLPKILNLLTQKAQEANGEPSKITTTKIPFEPQDLDYFTQCCGATKTLPAGLLPYLLFSPNSSRFLSPENFNMATTNSARENELLTRLSNKWPPKNSDNWIESVDETLQLIEKQKVSLQPAITTREADTLLYRIEAETYAHELRQENSPAYLAPKAPRFGLSLSELEHTSKDFLPDSPESVKSRYSLSLKIAYLFSHPDELKDFVIDSRVKEVITKIMDIKKRRQRSNYQDLVEWLSSDSETAPDWTFESPTHPQIPKPIEALPQTPVYEYLNVLPATPYKFYIADEPKNIPSDVSHIADRQAHLTAIKLNDVDTFNRTMTGLFGNPADYDNLGARTAQAIWKLSEWDIADLNRAPTPSELEGDLHNLHKYIGKGRRVGVYGKHAIDEEGNLIIVICAQHKNKTRK